jgi:hypothetical protein
MQLVPKRNRSPRGPLTVLAMFALGGAVLWGLFHARRAASPSSPDLPWGAPPRPLRFASLDCGGADSDRLGDTLLRVRQSDPDFILLQRVPAGNVIGFVERLGLQQHHSIPLYRRTGIRGHADTGCLILSKHPLYDARGIEPTGMRGACYGTWAVAAAEGVRFLIGSATSDLGGMDPVGRAWREAGSPPVVVGVSTPRNGPSSMPAGTGWKPVVADGSILTDSRWFAGGDGGTGFAAVELSGAPPSRLRHGS